MKKNTNETMNITINGTQYNNVPMAIAVLISDTLKPFKADKVATTKAEPKADKIAVYTKTSDGKGVLVGTNGYIPTKVFKGVTYSLKQAGAKWNKDTKAWTFDTKKACTEWCKAQDNR